MRTSFALLRLSAFLVLFFVGRVQGRAESHRATQLGSPATRFASPLATSEDLRSRFRDLKLQPDFAAVLKQWGWQGSLDDLFAAAARAEIEDTKIPVGEVMPFMSSRENGRPVCLRNVTWAGKEPAPALAFQFASNERRYRCITPKACCNFFVVDLGPEPRHGLTLDCAVSREVLVGRKTEACVTVRNVGNVVEPETIVTLPVPADCAFASATEGGVFTNNLVTWWLRELAVGSDHQMCASFNTRVPGALSFKPSVVNADVQPAQSSCETTVNGVSALLLEKADDPDPISVGDTTRYIVKVTNQGTADDTNVKMAVEFPAELDPVSASNGGTVEGKTVTFPAFPRLAPKEAFEYSIVAKE